MSQMAIVKFRHRTEDSRLEDFDGDDGSEGNVDMAFSLRHFQPHHFTPSGSRCSRPSRRSTPQPPPFTSTHKADEATARLVVTAR